MARWWLIVAIVLWLFSIYTAAILARFVTLTFWFKTLERLFKHNVYVIWQTRICSTWPNFPFTCRLRFIISTHNLVVSRNFEKFLTWIWRLPFAVYVKLKLSVIQFFCAFHLHIYFNNYWMRLSILRRIMKIEEGVARQITPSEISIILQMIRQPNSIIALSFIQNNS